MGTLLLIGIIIAFLLGGFFAGVEVGFVSLNRLSIELKKKQRSKNAFVLSSFLDEPSRFISGMIVGICICVVIYGMLIDQFLTPLWKYVEGYLTNEFVSYLLEIPKLKESIGKDHSFSMFLLTYYIMLK
jgi:CBS domain containing-hemolysin-like protein